MGIYSRWIFPWLCEQALDRPFVAVQRQRQLAEVHGEILEIGIGTGLNLPHYPSHVRSISAIDPNSGMFGRLDRRIQDTGLQVDRRVAGSEALPFPANRFDFVVSTFTLCSIAKAERTMAEIFRVLRPNGRFVFLEHGLSPDAAVQVWQRRISPIQQLLGDGCRLDRDIRRLLMSQPFSSLDIDNFALEQTPRPFGYMYRGMATKPAEHN